MYFLVASQPIGKDAEMADYKPAIGDTLYALGHPLAMNSVISVGIINAWQRIDGVQMIPHPPAVGQVVVDYLIRVEDSLESLLGMKINFEVSTGLFKQMCLTKNNTMHILG
jgi:hypothetical protein